MIAIGGVAWEMNTRADAKQMAIEAAAKASVVASEFKEFKDDTKTHFSKIDDAVANSASALQVLSALFQERTGHSTSPTPVSPPDDGPMKPKIIKE
jgi:hypothetical protein